MFGKINNLKLKYFIYLIVLFMMYSFGIITYRYNLEPIKTIRMIKNKNQNNKNQNQTFKEKINNSSFYDSVINDEISFLKTKLSEFKPSSIRKQILEDYIIKDYEIRRYKENNFNCFGDVEILETKFYNIVNRGVYSNRNSSKLFIYFQGHGGNPCDFDYFESLNSSLKNMDILSFSMFGLGLNEMEKIGFPIKLPGHKKDHYFYNQDFSRFGGNHDIIKFFHDKNNPNLEPLSLFISSPYQIINEIIRSKNYEEIIISGISGGGWYSTILSGLIQEIDRLYSFNGTLPLVYRIGNDNRGDFEQIYSQLWEEVDYYTFYLLSIFDDENNPTRLSYHIYSNEDICCFSSPEIDYFKQTIDSLDTELLKVKIFEKTEHEIDDEWLLNQITQ